MCGEHAARHRKQVGDQLSVVANLPRHFAENQIDPRQPIRARRDERLVVRYFHRPDFERDAGNFRVQRRNTIAQIIVRNELRMFARDEQDVAEALRCQRRHLALARRATLMPLLADYAQREKVHATVVGPEAPLAAGIVDVFRARNLRIFGPTKAAAQLESSKDFAKRFMTRHNIPTAKFSTFSDIEAAHAYIDAEGAPIVSRSGIVEAGDKRAYENIVFARFNLDWLSYVNDDYVNYCLAAERFKDFGFWRVPTMEELGGRDIAQ